MFYVDKTYNVLEDIPKYDVCFVGRLTEQKNPLHFVEIVNELKNSNKSINTIMVGNGDLYNEVKETISNLNLESTIFRFLWDAFPTGTTITLSNCNLCNMYLAIYIWALWMGLKLPPKMPILILTPQ